MIGDVYTFTIRSAKPFNSDPMPKIGQRFHVGKKTVKVIAIKIRDLVVDAVVI